MRFFLILLILSSAAFSKECYWDKKKHVCFKRFYNIQQLENPNPNKKYYTIDGNTIYTFTGKIKLKLKYSGAIMYLLDNYSIDILESKDNMQYILKAKHPNEHLSITTSLNNRDCVMSAKPILLKIYKKGERVIPDYDAPEPEKKKKSGKFNFKKAQ